MAIMKVIEVLAESDKGWEDAAQAAIKDASTTIRNIKSLNVKNASVSFDGGRPRYRLDAKISFEVEGGHGAAR